MYERPTAEVTHKKKKFTVQGFNVAESLACRSRFRIAQAKGDDEAYINLMVDMLDIAIVKPSVNKKKLMDMPEQDLGDLFEKVVEANGFTGKLKGKPKKR